jgi:chorismate mutase/prephenate dehydratase
VEHYNDIPAAATDLAGLRARIDAIDDRILELLNRRARCAQEVAEVKQREGETNSFYRPERETRILRRMGETNRGPLSEEAVMRLFREIMSECLALEKPLAVAYLGPAGTFTQQAAYKHFGHAAKTVPFPAIDEVFRAVESGACQFGVAPVENSTEGVINHTLDSFLRSPLAIVGESALRIHHNLMSRENDIGRIVRVFSHQQSLAQCRAWLDRFMPQAERIGASSNAEAARLASLETGGGAIAGEAAAELYGLSIVERNIEDESDNTTRFLIVGNQAVGPTGQDKTSLLLSARNHPGALHQILEPFARHGLSMSKIESRPSRKGLWDYVFFIDVEGHREDKALSQALDELQKIATLFRVLGSYPRAV